MSIKGKLNVYSLEGNEPVDPAQDYAELFAKIGVTYDSLMSFFCNVYDVESIGAHIQKQIQIYNHDNPNYDFSFFLDHAEFLGIMTKNLLLNGAFSGAFLMGDLCTDEESKQKFNEEYK